MRAATLASLSASVGAVFGAVAPSGSFRIGAYSVETADVWPTGLKVLSDDSWFLTTQVRGEEAQQKFTWDNATSRIVPVGQLSLMPSFLSAEEPELVFTNRPPQEEEEQALALLKIETIWYIVAPGTTDQDVMQWNSVFDQESEPAAFSFSGPNSPDANSALTLIIES